MATQQPTSEIRTGRVVRLHFSCHAELPIGSFLRVTGSTLWAPGTAATDPAEMGPAFDRTESAAFPVQEGDDAVAHPNNTNSFYSTAASLYTSSVEMVTTPEDYPIWTTRKPVVIIIHNSRKSVQHHYYRYLVVSPGGTAAMMSGEYDMDLDIDGADGAGVDGGGPIVSTSSETSGSTPVLQWEDPFGNFRADGRNTKGEVSTLSITSSVTVTGQVTKTDYRNLPYRTLDIDVISGTPVLEEGEGDNTGSPAGSTTDVFRLDHFNIADDISFRPYRIREAIHSENRRKVQERLSDLASTSENSEGGGDATMEEAVAASAAANNNNNGSPNRSRTRSGDQTPPVFSTNCRLFFVCFHLPVVVVQNKSSGIWRASWSESILAKTEGSSVMNNYESYWVGTVTTHPPLEKEDDKEKVRSLLKEMNCIPIFLDPEDRQKHYFGFCKAVLWPAFHNIDLLDLSTSGWLTDPSFGGSTSDWDQSRLDDWWHSYVQVNEQFCNLLSGLVRPQDVIWIHDYHLSLLPKQMSDWEVSQFGQRMTRKVFFLHIPFPTSQVFRELDAGESVLEGILDADVVGFHAFDHARHFLNAAKRILGLNYETLSGGLIGVSYQGRTVVISMSNVSIEPRMVDAALMLPSVKDGMEDLKRKHAGRIIIGAVDIGQRLSGTALKLLAFERLLQDYPVWQSRVVIVQRVMLPGSRKADEAETARELRAMYKRIVDKFGPDVIDYQEIVGTSPPMDQRLALWKASDILMLTPIREGLNHWPMEYIYAHKAPDPPGVVITSEFSAVSSILNGALRVNPFDIQNSIITIDKALSMDMEEREGRRYRDIDFVSGSPSDKWTKNVLRDLRDATINYRKASSESNSQAATPLGSFTPKTANFIDSTAAFLARESSLAFASLDMNSLKRAYDVTKRRCIFLDFNGTIVMKEPPGKYLKREILGTSGNKPPPMVIEALDRLCADPRTTVYVVSGDSSENVLDALGHIPGIGLAVSNGARYSPPLQPGETQRQWRTFDLGVDWDAVKRVSLPILSKYTARSNGSWIKLTSFSIGWSYYSTDPEWGSLQAAHLLLELENELRAFDVRFVTLKGIIEIVPRKLNKGLIVKKVLRDTQARHPEGVDFVLCFGDDISDEKMFTSVFTFVAELGDESNIIQGPPVVKEDGTLETPLEISSPAQIPDPCFAFTVAVGKKPSHASMYVNTGQDVANALVMLAYGKIPAGGVPVWAHSTSSHLFD